MAYIWDIWLILLWDIWDIYIYSQIKIQIGYIYMGYYIVRLGLAYPRVCIIIPQKSYA